MKALLLSGLLLIAGTFFLSADVKHAKDLSHDKTFINSIELLSSVANNMQTVQASQLNDELKKIANSIAILKERYPDLVSPATSGRAIDRAIDKLSIENKTTIHGDTCLRELVKAIFSCFCGTGPRETVNACLATACANYHACKDAGTR